MELNALQTDVQQGLRPWWLGAVGIFVLGVLVRWPLMGQSFWYDELVTVQQFVTQSTRHRVMGGSEYVPNNHVLYTLCAKAALRAGRMVHWVGNGPEWRSLFEPAGRAETVVRLPACLAGALVGLALAWPLRRRWGVALLVALMATINPWLVSMSGEARGYTLMLLLCVMGTNWLFGQGNWLAYSTTIRRASSPATRREQKPTRYAWLAYALLMAGALYTLPIAGIILIAQGLAIVVLRLQRPGRWLGAAGMAVVVGMVLYAPLAKGMWHYYRDPYVPTLTYGEFVNLLPQMALAGQADVREGWLLAGLLAVLLLGGGIAAWRQDLLRPALLTYAIAVVLSLGAGLVIPSAHEVRFVPWLIPLTAICLAGLVCSPRPRILGTGTAILGFYVMFAGQCINQLWGTPIQPLREAGQLLDQWVKPGQTVADAYLAGSETLLTYSHLERSQIHRWEGTGPFPDAPTYMSMRGDAARQNAIHAAAAAEFVPREKWVIVVYPKLTQRDEPLMWRVVQRDYIQMAVLVGRLTDVEIYCRKTP